MEQKEIDMINDIKNGDMEAFEAMLDVYQKLIYNICYRMFNNKEDAEDLTQDVFVKVYNKINSFSEKNSFKSWLCAIATNTCIDELRKRKNKSTISIDKNIETDDGNMTIDIPSNEKTPEEAVVKNEEIHLLENALLKLNLEDREIIVLRDIQGLSYDEISEIKHMKLGTVKSKLARARLKLQKILKTNMEQN